MRILIAGASGMIGSVTAAHLAGQGHDVVRLVRRPPQADEVRWDPDAGMIDAAGLEGFDAVVHLATMPWAGRWTTETKNKQRANRLATNGILARSLSACQQKPSVLVCASGMGIYPSSGEEIITEASPLGTSWLATLQRDGEAATLPASEAGVRVVNLRIPAVLGGVMTERNMGRVGNGRQWWSWIGRSEMPYIIEHVLMAPALVGPVNTVSPNPVRCAEFAATLSRCLGKKPTMPIPAFVMRLMLGDMGEEFVLASRRMAPQKLLATGYRFMLPDLEPAIRHELSAEGAKPITQAALA